MPNGHNFQHLPLILRYQGPAKLFGGAEEAAVTQQNRQNRPAHSSRLKGQFNVPDFFLANPASTTRYSRICRQ